MVVDCNPWAWGCDGGATAYIVRNWMAPYGVKNILAADYPYITASNASCNPTNAPRVAVGPTSQIDISGAGEVYVSNLQIRPVVVRIAAGNNYFRYYSSGILNDSNCWCTGRIDHAVLAVGYGVENGKSYMNIRNSWGTGYGENGHIRIMMTGDGIGICGNQ